MEPTYFNTFFQEKEWAKTHEIGNRHPWGLVKDIDRGISDIVQLINGIDFLYTSGDSCSGEPGEARHFSGYCGRLKVEGRSSESPGITFRAVRSDSRYNVLVQDLRTIDSLTILEGIEGDPTLDRMQADSSVQNGVLQIQIPDEIKSNLDHPAYSSYLCDRWDQVYTILKGYSTTHAERIDMRQVNRGKIPNIRLFLNAKAGIKK